MEQKESQLVTLRLELSVKQTELDRLRGQVETLRSEENKHLSRILQLEGDLEAQRTKNNVSFFKYRFAF